MPLGSHAGWRTAQLCGPETGLKSGEPITLKKLGAAMGAAGQGLQSSAVCCPLRRTLDALSAVRRRIMEF